MVDKKKPTIHDVARVSGKSLGTISRVLNEHPSVSIKARAAVEEAIKKLGYTPNAIAASLRTRSTKLIGMMVTDLSNPLFAIMANTAENLLQESGYSLIIANTHDNSDAEVMLIELFIKRKLDGLILSLHDEKNPKLEKILKSISVPVVLLDREMSLPFDAVMTDHEHGMRQAVEYLLGLGHTRIGLVTVSELASPGRGRIQGYAKAYENAGIEFDKNLVRCGSLDADFGYQEAISLLGLSGPPTALIAGGNQILPGILRALTRLEISIPDDISLISCDDTPLSELSKPAITVIDRDISSIGTAAAKLLLRRLEGSDDGGARQVVLDTDLVLRASCGRRDD